MKDRNETEARTKWCPFACMNHLIMQGSASHNIYSVSPDCKGDSCVFWEEKTATTGRCTLAPN